MRSLLSLPLLAHLVATAALTGLIWVIQRVHYPAFLWVAPERFAAFEAFHSRSITPVVGLLMLAELLTGVWLLAQVAHPTDRLLAGAGLLLIGLLWLHTAFVAVPLHGKLAAGYDATVIGRLVATNWIRTAAWTLRLGLVVALCWRQFNTVALGNAS